MVSGTILFCILPYIYVFIYSHQYTSFVVFISQSVNFMFMQIPIRKHVLRLLLGLVAFIIPIMLPLGQLVSNANSSLFMSLQSYLSTDIGMLVMIMLILFALILVVFGLAYSRGRRELFVASFLSLMFVLFPGDLLTVSWLGYLHSISLLGFLAALGWLILHTFNLPLRFPTLSKIGVAILILDGLLFVWLLFFLDLWPPLAFVLETAILWLFTVGIFIRHQITKKLGG